MLIQNTANKAMHEVPLLAHMLSLLSNYCSLHTTYITHISIIMYHFCYISSSLQQQFHKMSVPQGHFLTQLSATHTLLALSCHRSLQLDPIIIDEVRTLEWDGKFVSSTRLLCLEVHKHMVLLRYLRFLIMVKFLGLTNDSPS